MSAKLKAAAATVAAAVKLGKSKDECVKVCVRIRPLSNKEKQDGRVVIAIADNKSSLVTVKNPRGDDSEPPKTFTFSACNCFLSRLLVHPSHCKCCFVLVPLLLFASLVSQLRAARPPARPCLCKPLLVAHQALQFQGSCAKHAAMTARKEQRDQPS